MSLRSRLSHIRRSILCGFCTRKLPLGSIGPVVSFTFDDFPRTAYTVGGRILEQVGARGTYYVSCGLMNATNQLGELCRIDDLHALAEKGHELGSQTFRHSSGRSLSTSAFKDDVKKGIGAVEEITGLPAANFAYPYGHATLRTKKSLETTVTSSRGIVPGLNGPLIDLNLLRGNRIYGDVEGSSDMLALIEENVRQRSWLIFYTHDVRQQPSLYGCTAALLESVVSAAARTGNRILTVAQVLAEMGLPGSLTQPVDRQNRSQSAVSR